MTYKEQLKDKRWDIKRTEILLRDDFTCQHPGCGIHGDFLQVHHLDYIPGIRAWEYPNDMLTTLCKDHHSEEQDREKVEKYLYNTLKMKGFFLSDLLSFACKIDTDTVFVQSLLKTLRKNG